ncbi:MAG TPA: lycopene cyclase family protein, partial [Kofleriaceae bacterium]|nr:lycopene cyclase family protein [Kofleriaceae bacterium]
MRARQPEARIVMIERGEAVGGNHTWCFHAGDLGSGAASWIEPLVVARWPGYDVAFEGQERTLDAPYACVTSRRLAECVEESLRGPGSVLFTRTTAVAVGVDAVEIEVPWGKRRVVR